MNFFRSIIILFCLGLVACAGPAQKEALAVVTDSTVMAELKWPEGKYLFVDTSGFYYEEWAKGDSGVCKGRGYFLTKNGVDTLFCMSMNIKRQKGATIMYYSVKGEHQKKDIELKLTKEDRDFYVFENPIHDFPSIMDYRILGDSAIEIKEQGFPKGKEKIRNFIVKRID